MIHFMSKKIIALLLPILLILMSLSGCTNSTSTVTQTGTSVQSTTVATPQSSAAPVSRLSDILDGKKYANQFTIRVFNIGRLDPTSGKINYIGDTILLQSPDGKNMLIDTGYASTMENIIQDMKKLGVTRLDYLVATHMHGDHIGGVSAVLDAFSVDKIIASKYATRNIGSAKTFMSALNSKGKEFTVVKEGDTFQFGKDIKVEVLSPVGDIEIPDDTFFSNQVVVNEQSIVLKITYGSNTFLFCGDIQLNTEMRLIEKYGDKINVDVVKVPHHGNDSSNNTFIEATSPSIALICQSAMPKMDILQRYQNAKCKVYFGGLDGHILVSSDGKNINIITEKDRVGSLKP